ncbi:phage tail protein [Azospirillum griseum]|uniref:Tail fiber protein n=1 Tax=Azospirillum griseum TaxID=2496639 RepID=A0A3S0JL54_9PROT|nr:phage tail protein [Azospirillum griseum]RTR23526.1 tail fiber protein [Azospirillum griseum]
MLDSFFGQIALLAFDRVPKGFMKCEGQVLNYSIDKKFIPLYSLIGNRFGGNSARHEFNLPDLRGKSPVPEMCYMICVDGIYPEFDH